MYENTTLSSSLEKKKRSEPSGQFEPPNLRYAVPQLKSWGYKVGELE